MWVHCGNEWDDGFSQGKTCSIAFELGKIIATLNVLLDGLIILSPQFSTFTDTER